MAPLKIIIRHRSHMQRGRETVDNLNQRPWQRKAVTIETHDGISNKNPERTSLKKTNVRRRERDSEESVDYVRRFIKFNSTFGINYKKSSAIEFSEQTCCDGTDEEAPRITYCGNCELRRTQHIEIWSRHEEFNDLISGSLKSNDRFKDWI